MTTSAHLAASGGVITLNFAASAFFAEAEPGRSATTHVLDAAVAQIVGVGMALAAIADDRDLLALDQVHIGIAVVINAHVLPPLRG